MNPLTDEFQHPTKLLELQRLNETSKKYRCNNW